MFGSSAGFKPNWIILSVMWFFVKFPWLGRYYFGGSRLKVPELRSLRGSGKVKEMNNFFWVMERYFVVMYFDNDEFKINIAIMYFVNDDILWWR